MAYKFANNDNHYYSYEQKILNLLQLNKLDFLSDENSVGIFDVSIEYGKKYCKQILNEFPEFIKYINTDTFKNDLEIFKSVGSQNNFYSEDLDLNLTANCARYLYHALLIIKYLNEKFGSNNYDILEIGGGYGGLCYWMRKLNKNISSYSIIDLPAASKLQDSCSIKWNINCKTINDPSEFKKSSNPLFVISNYGYAEFNQYYQDLYKNTVLKLADAGFMIWNNWTGIYNFTDLNMKIENERPYFDNLFNKFIYF